MSAHGRSNVERVVLDASALVRAFVDRNDTAAHWVARIDEDVSASAPALVLAEFAQALLGYVRAGLFDVSAAHERLELVVGLPLTIHPLDDLVQPALTVAANRGLSLYDACYAVLAEADEAVLVTADRQLAAAVTRAELVV